ncbi:MAG: hypothetical protein AAFV53_14935 [Myxococcota bacterium]
MSRLVRDSISFEHRTLVVETDIYQQAIELARTLSIPWSDLLAPLVSVYGRKLMQDGNLTRLLSLHFPPAQVAARRATLAIDFSRRTFHHLEEGPVASHLREAIRIARDGTPEARTVEYAMARIRHEQTYQSAHRWARQLWDAEDLTSAEWARANLDDALEINEIVNDAIDIQASRIAELLLEVPEPRLAYPQEEIIANLVAFSAAYAANREAHRPGLPWLKRLRATWNHNEATRRRRRAARQAAGRAEREALWVIVTRQFMS